MRDDRNKYGPAENGQTILSRRSLFELAGLAVATAALPPSMLIANPAPSREMTGQGVSPVMDKLSTYMSEATGRELPDEATEKTKQHILDTLAAAGFAHVCAQLIQDRNSTRLNSSHHIISYP